jgi:hypothetical protein
MNSIYGEALTLLLLLLPGCCAGVSCRLHAVPGRLLQPAPGHLWLPSNW